ncbi:hypothetical protein HY469_04100 [Candidatus Roizmanbacteria bacterium]|nr:hypothetical protein [Candidatus Roizmanbacteria bacterium]
MAIRTFFISSITVLFIHLFISVSPVFAQTEFGPIVSERPETPPNACTHYVSTTGNNINSGTGSANNQAWRTIVYAVTQLSAGNVLCIEPGTYTESAITMTASGTASNPIIIKKSGTGEVTLSAGSGVREMFIISGSDYVIIDGLTFTRTVANWSSGVYPWIIFRSNADNNIFQNNTITSEQLAPSMANGDYYFARRHEGLAITQSDNVQILYNNFHNISKGIRVYGIDNKRVVIRGNHTYDTFVHGLEMGPPVSCDVVPLPPQAILVENNLFEGSYIQDGIQIFTQPNTQPPPCNGILTQTGSIIRRNIIRNNNENALDLKGATHILIEDNVIYGTDGDNDGPYLCSGTFGECFDNVAIFQDRRSHFAITRGAGTPSEANIIRNNVFYDNSAIDPNIGYKIYNNTFLYNNHDFRGNHDTSQGTPSNFYAIAIPGDRRDISIKNNIITQHINAEIAIKAPVTNLEIRNNLYWNTATLLPASVRFKTNYRNGAEDNAGQIDFDAWKTQTGDQNSIIATPQFVDVISNLKPTGDHTQYDFRLQSTSSAVDAGTTLTTTTSAGTGTSVQVTDARYFYSSNGLMPNEDDTIQIGTNPSDTAQIRAINYGTNTLTLSRSLTWSSGASVNLPYEGSAPDIGAYEYVASPSTPTPTTSGTQPVSNVSLQFTCISSPSTTNAATLSWTNLSGQGASLVQVRTAANSWSNSFRRTFSQGSTNSISLPDNFTEYTGSTQVVPLVPLTLQPDTLYYHRIYNGVYTTPDAPFTIPSCSPQVPGDTNGDNHVNIVDLSTLLSNFGGTQKSLQHGDVVGNDGVVDVADLATLLANFGM